MVDVKVFILKYLKQLIRILLLKEIIRKQIFHHLAARMPN
jgi:hypothetical protein